MKTAVKVIGEASKNKKWGTGIHISDKDALNSKSWEGDNLMGAILMRIRNELQESEARETVQVMDMLLAETSKVSNSTEQQPCGTSNQEGREIWEEEVSETAVQPDAEVTGQTGFDNMVESGIHLENFENENVKNANGEANETEMVVDQSLELRSAEPNSDAGDPKTRDHKTPNHDESDEAKSENIENNVIKEKLETILLIGASNTRGLVLEDEHMPLGVQLNSKGGTKLRDVASRVEECTLEPSTVPVVAVHLGSCDFSMGPEGPTTAKQVYAEYIEALNIISTKFKQAELAIASVPPRRALLHGAANADQFNIEIRKLNDMLRNLSKHEENVTFIDNTDLFFEDNKVRTNIFKDHIHLNKEGKALLGRRLMDGLKEAFYKYALRSEWDVIPKGNR